MATADGKGACEHQQEILLKLLHMIDEKKEKKKKFFFGSFIFLSLQWTFFCKTGANYFMDVLKKKLVVN